MIGNAVKVMRIAIGEDDEELTEDGDDKAAQALGHKGGGAMAKKLPKEGRVKIAKAAAKARWKMD